MDEVRTGAPVGQTPPTPPAPPPGPTPTAAKGPPLQLPAPQGGAISVVTDQMAWRLAKLNALATMREFARLGMKVEWNAERPDILERARAAADELYGSIIQTAGQRVKDYFAQQLAEGKAPPDVAKALSEQFRGVSGRQARMVARTVTRQLYNEAALDAYEAAGVREVTASDGHGGLTGKTDKACLARNGKTFTIAEARLEEHSPTTHPNCLTADTPVTPVGGVVTAYRAWWSGPMVTLGTAHARVTVGPNHPMLTTAGWKKASLLREGDHLLRCTQRRAPTDVEHLKHMPATAEQIFEALRADRARAWRVGGTPEQFHGDGGYLQGEVDVVRSDRPLTTVLHAEAVQQDSEGILSGTGVEQAFLAGLGPRDLAAHRVGAATSRRVRRTGVRRVLDALTHPHAALTQIRPDCHLAAAEIRRDLERRFAFAVPGRDHVPVDVQAQPTATWSLGHISLTQPTKHRCPADTELASDHVGSLPIAVSLDEILSVKIEPFHGWVYDLQTESGVYLADGECTKNCTLSWRPVVPDEGLRSEDSVMNAALPANGHRHLLLVWEAEKHPRWPKGTPRVGGEWMDTESVVDLVRMGAPGVRDLSFLARGAQRIRSIHGAERGDGVDLHVELGDGSSHVLHVPRATHWSTVQRAISAVDAAPSSSGTPSSAGEKRTVEKMLADIAAGERFRLVTDPTGLYQTFERVTPGESKRGDGRITVRNVDTGKRVHMAPDRRIDHFTREKPLTRMRVADLKPGDRFFVGDRQYELLPQGGSKRKDGRITGRELATGKRVHFKPDREVERRRGPAKPPAPPPPPPPKPPPKPPAPPPIPEWKPGLPPGEQPLPPKVEIPGRRLRDMRHPDSGGKPFTYRGESYIRLGRPGALELHGQPRGTVPVKLNAPGSSVRFLPDSALVVPEGESDPYGPPGPARRAALLAKAREVYRSRRGPQSEDEYRDVGALVHEAMLEAAPGAPGNTAMAAHERGELRAALAEIRTLARGTTSTFRGAGLEQISDHDNNPASVRDPDAVERAEFMQAERWFPESWMNAVEDDGGTKIAVGVWRGFYRHGFVAGQPEARLIAVSDSKPQVIQHEMGHRVENALPTIQTLCTEFWQRRTSGDPTTKLYEGRDEVTKEDHFASKYMGKVYGMRGGGEIFSMGIEDLVHPYSRYPEGQGSRSAVGKYSLLHQDADYAHFMLGLLAALKTDAEVAQIMEEERRLSGE